MKVEDLQKSVADLAQSVGAMAVDLKTVTGDIRGLRQQIEDFGEDLDGVKRRLADPDKVPVQPRVEIPQANKAPMAARLTNNGPPLLDKTPGNTGFVTAPSSPKDADIPNTNGDYVVRPRRHDFPRFSGDKPLLWVDLCTTYFEMYRVPEHHWVSSATLHLDGHAALWFQAYKRQHRLLGWNDFMQAVIEEFGQDEFDGQMTRLLQLKQTGTVSEYRLAFEECMYHLISLDGSLSPR